MPQTADPLANSTGTPPQGITETTTPEPRVHAGLEGVYAATTRLSHVEGEQGRLTLVGYPVEAVAPQATFEEMAFLLFWGRRPTGAELGDFVRRLHRATHLPDEVVAGLRSAATTNTSPLEALRLGLDLLSLELNTATEAGTTPDPERDEEVAVTLLARAPRIVSVFERLRNGSEPATAQAIEAQLEQGGIAQAYLFELSGQQPSSRAVRALNTYLNTVSDHGFNASTFAARVVCATQSDLLSAVVAAIGALKGPLHGGAPGPALDLVFEIGELERAESVLREKVEAGERLMGFGHRVYRVRDPRADVLNLAARELFDDDDPLYRLALGVEEVALEVLRELKPHRPLDTNVEFYTALVLHGLGLGTDLFTPTFAVGRTAGWLAHCFEQRAEGRLIRPRAHYIGEHGQSFEKAAS